MRLSTLVPSIPANLVSSLEANGIRTDTDFLFTTPIFDIYKRLPPNTVTLQELKECASLVSELCSAPGQSALELYRIETLGRNDGRELHTGIQELDVILSGLGGGKVIEISGDKGSGKSTFALNLLLNHLASNPDDSAVWIDTSGGFSPQKATDILATKQLSHAILDRMEVSLSFDIDTAQLLVDGLKENPHTNFLVIDSITPLLGPLLSAVSAQGHALMIDFMRRLQSFAQVTRATVIVINNTVSKGLNSRDRQPALGPSFALMPDTTLWLQASPDDATNNAILHTVQILRSRSKQMGAFSKFSFHDNVLYAS